jgi:CMP-N-acetylneuraminic acid synthetase
MTICIIPARGGSKGIPRKNIRELNGKPLIAYAIQSAQRATLIDRVVVTTDCEMIASVARHFGAEILMRPKELGADDITIDPVIHHAVFALDLDDPEDVVVKLQPTCPLITPETLDHMIDRLRQDGEGDTIVAASDDTHIRWWMNEMTSQGVCEDERMNRQDMSKAYKETGCVATRVGVITAAHHIGDDVEMEIIGKLEATDIDDYEDWLIAEAALNRKKIAIITLGDKAKGLGHAYRAKTLASLLGGHDVKIAACEVKSKTAVEFLLQEGTVTTPMFRPDIIVFDKLDTTEVEVRAAKATGARVITFEDSGPGAEYADAVINALYPSSESGEGRYYGHEYYVMRDEFLYAERLPLSKKVERVLITFGGTDPADLTARVINALRGLLADVILDVVLGPGYPPGGVVDRDPGSLGFVVHRNASDMPGLMATADLAFTSAGRTVYELAHMGILTISIAANNRECRHTFASQPGMLFLGHEREVVSNTIRNAFKYMLMSIPHWKPLAHDLTQGRDRVRQIILGG